MIVRARRIRKVSLWLAVSVALSAGVAALLIATRAMAPATILDGWGTGVLFSVVWGAIVQYRAVDRPARHHLRNATCSVLMELSANYQALAFRKSVSVGGLAFDMYEQHGATVIGSLEVDATLALMALYRSQRLLTSYKIYRLSGWFTARQLDSGRKKGEIEYLVKTFLRGVEKLDLSLDPAIDSVRDNFARAYHLPRARP